MYHSKILLIGIQKLYNELGNWTTAYLTLKATVPREYEKVNAFVYLGSIIAANAGPSAQIPRGIALS